MTRQEALTVLRNTAWLGTDEHREAVEVAIEVLEETSQNLAKPFNADQHVQRVGNVGVEVADAIACNNCPDLTLDEYDLFTGGLTNPKYYRCANIEIC